MSFINICIIKFLHINAINSLINLFNVAIIEESIQSCFLFQMVYLIFKENWNLLVFWYVFKSKILEKDMDDWLFSQCTSEIAVFQLKFAARDPSTLLYIIDKSGCN